MFKSSARPREPISPETRQRALWQGALGVLGPGPGMIGASWLLSAAGSTGRVPLLVVFFLCLVAEIYGVWRLGMARDGRWDGRGILALGLLCLGYPLLFFFASWFAIGLQVMITGRPFAPYGNS